jgi:predicted DNA binding CopG/RHH family protein
MNRKVRPPPQFRDEAEERLFWESHDSIDYVDWSAAERVRLPNLKPSTRSISLRLPVSLLERIKIAANKRDVPYQSLIKTWLAEKADSRRGLAAFGGRQEHGRRLIRPGDADRRESCLDELQTINAWASSFRDGTINERFTPNQPALNGVAPMTTPAAAASGQGRADGPRVVIVICDSLRHDLVGPDDTPFLVELSERGARFAAHRSVFPSTTRASAASIATGCLPARHGLLGNTMALDEGDGLICRSAGHPDFPDRMRRATGRTLHVPTLAERLRWQGENTNSFANVSPGSA